MDWIVEFRKRGEEEWFEDPIDWRGPEPAFLFAQAMVRSDQYNYYYHDAYIQARVLNRYTRKRYRHIITGFACFNCRFWEPIPEGFLGLKKKVERGVCRGPVLSGYSIGGDRGPRHTRRDHVCGTHDYPEK
jgi:hypothetical protein